MESLFIWVPGTWEVRAEAQAGGRPLQARAHFQLTKEAVGRMKAMAQYYPAALGVAPAWRFWANNDAQPLATVELQPLP